MATTKKEEEKFPKMETTKEEKLPEIKKEETTVEALKGEMSKPSGLPVQQPKVEDKKEELLQKFYETGALEQPKLKELPKSREERLLEFVASRQEGMVRLNDFLKSLYPVPKYNEPALWLQQGESKGLRVMIEKLQAEGKLTMKDSRYLQLGRLHYPDDKTMKSEYHNLNTVEIVVVK